MRAAVPLLLSGALLAAAGCRPSGIPSAGDAARVPGGPSKEDAAAQPTPTESVKPEFPYVHTADLRARPQLLSGWHAIEDGGWRWMGREAQAVLPPPKQTPAMFEARLFFPDGHMQKVGGPVTVAVLIGGAPFTRETYPRPGAYTISRPLTATPATGQPLKVTFQVDRFLPPTGADRRELGAVINSFGLK